MAHTSSLTARDSSTNPFGKCDSLIRAMVPEQVKLDLIREAARLGMGESEFLRELLMVRLYGLDVVVSMDRVRLAAVAGTEHETRHVQEGA